MSEEEKDYIPFDLIYASLVREYPDWIDIERSNRILLADVSGSSGLMSVRHLGNIVMRKEPKPALDYEGDGYELLQWYESEERKWSGVINHIKVIGFEPRYTPYQSGHFRKYAGLSSIDEANALYDIPIGTSMLVQIVNSRHKVLKRNDGNYKDRIFIGYRPRSLDGRRLGR